MDATGTDYLAPATQTVALMRQADGDPSVTMVSAKLTMATRLRKRRPQTDVTGMDSLAPATQTVAKTRQASGDPSVTMVSARPTMATKLSFSELS